MGVEPGGVRLTGDDALYLKRPGKTCLLNSACSEMNPLSVLHHQPHDTSSLVYFYLPCFEFLLLSILGNLANCRQLICTRNDAPEGLSMKLSLHITTPSVVVGRVEFLKKWK